MMLFALLKSKFISWNECITVFPSYYDASSFSLLCYSTSVVAIMTKVDMRGKI